MSRCLRLNLISGARSWQLGGPGSRTSPDLTDEGLGRSWTVSMSVSNSWTQDWAVGSSWQADLVDSENWRRPA